MLQKTGIVLIITILWACIIVFGQDSVKFDKYFDLSIEELLNLDIVTSSNFKEPAQDAPAMVIVISEQEIKERGYLELYDVLNDLPGFDLSRAFGDDDYYIYARGYRKTTSDHMLLMVDGHVMNHLYNNNMHAFGQYPLSNIRQIEILYGPVSAIHGANAYAGAINLITKDKSVTDIMISAGPHHTQIADLHIYQKINDLELRLSARINKSNGTDYSNAHPFLNDKFYNDTNFWKPFKNSEFMGYQSPVHQFYYSGNVRYKELTLGFLKWHSKSGYGNVHPADKVLNGALWQFMQDLLYLDYEKQFGKLKSKTAMSFRNSNNPGTSMFIERNYIDKDNNFDSAEVAVSYWGTSNRAYAFRQDISFSATDKLLINAGLKWELRELQKQYDISYGPAIKADTAIDYPFASIPHIADGNYTQHNHYFSEDKGIYSQVRYLPHTAIDIIAGCRYDYNSIYKDVWSPRIGGIIKPYKKLSVKLFYGTAYLEPTPRSLYGGWSASLSNPDLKPEKIQTYEGAISYSFKNWHLGALHYSNIGRDVISNIGITPQNIGKRKMNGGEIFVKGLINKPLSQIDKIKTDVFVSYINSQEDLLNTGSFENTGNMATWKVHGIVTLYFINKFSVSFLNRYIDDIKTVKTNPIKTIDGYFVQDVFINASFFKNKTLSTGIKVYNIYDVRYYHPGYREADAGENAFDDTGNIIPSKSWYNSRLPQPGRMLYLVVSLQL